MAQRVGIVGGGIMGSAIGYVVVLRSPASPTIVDQNEELLGRCREKVEQFIRKGVERGIVAEPQASEMQGRVRYTTSLADIAPAEIVIEAVFEDLGAKQRVFEQLDEVCSPGAILASNTSSISITQIAGATRHPERVVGTHFFNPVPVMKLVELVRGVQTSDETVAGARRFCEGLGKEVVVSLDTPGFITTRIGQAYLCEALRCLEEGVGTVQDIDRGVQLAYNFPMGPFQLFDLIGLDTELRIMDFLSNELGKQFDPGPILRQMVAENRLGRKTGRGFFEYGKANKSEAAGRESGRV